MAPVVKIMTSTRFIYEQNNFIAFMDKTNVPQEFHGMTDFIKGCKLAYAMPETPTIHCEVVEEIWTSPIYDLGSKILSFTLKCEIYTFNFFL